MLVRFGVDWSDEKVETRKEGGDVCSETHANEIREMGKVDHGCPAFDKASASRDSKGQVFSAGR